MSGKSYLLVFDIGTTGVRACLCNRDGALFSTSHVPLPQIFPSPGWVEQDPADLWRLSMQVAEEALRQGSTHWGEIAAIGLTNQRETVIFWDRETGNPVYNAIVWQCRRTQEQCDALRQKGLSGTIQAKTGLIIDPYFSASKMQWLFQHVPEANTLFQQGRLLAGTVDTWILWHLSGRSLHVTDFSNASRTMLWNIHTRSWDPDLLALFDIPPEILPQVAAPPFGETDPAITGGHRIPIALSVGDQQAALFGQRCWDRGAAKSTYGTGTFLMANLGDQPVISEGGLLTTLAYNRQLQPVYALEGAVFTAGAALEWLQNKLECFQTPQEATRMAESLPDNGGVYLVPAFVGLAAPYWDSDARGLLTGLTFGAGKAHLVRAAFEAMAYQTREIIDLMAKESGFRMSALKIDGGVSRSDFLSRFLADILGIPVLRTPETEATALGTAYLTALAIGFEPFNLPSEAFSKAFDDESPTGGTRFLPAMASQQREMLYQGWHQAIQKTILHP